MRPSTGAMLQHVLLLSVVLCVAKRRQSQFHNDPEQANIISLVNVFLVATPVPFYSFLMMFSNFKFCASLRQESPSCLKILHFGMVMLQGTTCNLSMCLSCKGLLHRCSLLKIPGASISDMHGQTGEHEKHLNRSLKTC